MTDRKLIGTGPWLKYLWKGHITNWLWHDRLTRRTRRNLAYGEFKMDYLKRYADFARNIKPEPPSPSDTDSPDNIFTLWFQGEENAPEVVKRCLDSIKRRYPQNFILLTDNNLYDFISLPDYIMAKYKEGKIRTANFSDLVRIELLYNYGGYWFDATDYLTGNIPDKIAESPFFMFVAGNDFFPHMFVQTCFMRCRQKDPLLGMWRDLVFEYWRKEIQACDYFLVHMLFKLLVKENAQAAALFAEMPKMIMDPTHLLWYKYGNQPFDKNIYNQICKETFFQKCSYRPQRNGVRNLVPGSFADCLVKGQLPQKL